VLRNTDEILTLIGRDRHRFPIRYAPSLPSAVHGFDGVSVMRRPRSGRDEFRETRKVNLAVVLFLVGAVLYLLLLLAVELRLS
jgi:hypothetical protein